MKLFCQCGKTVERTIAYPRVTCFECRKKQWRDNSGKRYWAKKSKQSIAKLHPEIARGA